MTVWLLMLALFWPNLPRVRRLVLMLPLGIMGLFGLWRIVGVQSIGVTDDYVGRMITAPGALLERLLLGYKISFLWGWTEPIIAALDQVTSALPAMLLLAGAVLLCLALAWSLGRRLAPAGGSAAGDKPMLVIRTYLLFALFGIVLTGAGYIPILFVFLPSLAGIGSRFNLFATLGGAVTLASGLMLIAQLLAQRGRPTWLLALAGATPLLLLAVAFQSSVQKHNQLAWQEQQQLWQQLFLQAPDIADDTFVLFILPDMEDRTGFINWRRTPLSASWEASSGVRLLYDNSSLAADVYFPDIEEPIEPILTQDGVFTLETAEVTPYSRVVAFHFDAAAGTLEQLEQLPANLIAGGDRLVTLCQNCVLPVPAIDVEWRRLVLE